MCSTSTRRSSGSHSWRLGSTTTCSSTRGPTPGTVLPGRVRDLLGYYVAHGLPDVPLAYPTDWGIPHGSADQRVDVWVEMGLGLLAQVGAHFGAPAATLTNCLAAWRNAGPAWHFLG